MNLTRGKLYYAAFFSRYAFTHIIATGREAVVYNALTRDKRFRVIYESERVDGTKIIYCKVFIPKGGGIHD